jgi:hypothetical protein
MSPVAWKFQEGFDLILWFDAGFSAGIDLGAKNG